MVQEKDGFFYSTRHGFKVVIKYPDGGNDDIEQYAPLHLVEEDADKPRKILEMRGISHNSLGLSSHREEGCQKRY